MATTLHTPANVAELADLLRQASATGQTASVTGGGTKAALGRPVVPDLDIHLDAFAGVVSFEPEEMVLVAGAATRMARIEALLAEANQMLAFEPPDWATLWGAPARRATLGGTVACNLSGSRRIKAGAARDHLLGLDGVTGAGEVFKAGGRVVKNVTGYDLCKLFAGSFGTLAVATRLVLRTVPRPEVAETLVFASADDASGIDLLGQAAASPMEPSGLAHLPAGIGGMRLARTLVRLEGTPVSVAARVASLGRLGKLIQRLDGPGAAPLWADLGTGALVAEGGGDLWRLSLPPSGGAGAAAQIAAAIPGARHVFDWAGGLIWLAVPAAAPGYATVMQAASIRAAVGDHGGGHATLVRASAEVRGTVAPFAPEDAGLALLAARVKQAFDPSAVLEPGRMVAGR